MSASTCFPSAVACAVGLMSILLPACDLDGDRVPGKHDCAPSDAEISPLATEICNGIDDDCDGKIDDADASVEEENGGIIVFVDADGDGHGDPDGEVLRCATGPGFAERSTDCNDSDSAAWTGATEVCDGSDNDCDGTTDRVDLDADGHLPEECGGDDCDDADDATYAGAVEQCGSGIDEDCDGDPSDCLLSGLESALDAPACIEESGAHDGFGFVLAGAGDLTGDGQEDIIASTPGRSAWGWEGGKVYIMAGEPVGYTSTSSAIRVSQDTDESKFGEGLVGTADLNGDGFADLAVGDTYPDPGAVYVLFGPIPVTTSASEAGLTLPGASSSDSFGSVLASARIEGAPGLVIASRNASTARPELYWLAGPITSATTEEDLVLVNRGGSGSTYESLAAGSDADGDGVDDIVVGDPGGDGVYLFLGPPETNGSSISIAGGASEAGAAVDFAGDVDGDGLADLIVGAPGADDSRGVALLITAPHTGTASLARPTAQWAGLNESDEVGLSVSAAGDVNGDGRDDVLVGMSPTHTNFQYAILALGPVEGDRDIENEAASFVYPDSDSYEGYGRVADAGDLNHDGAADLLVAFPQGTLSTSGTVCYFAGGAGP